MTELSKAAVLLLRKLADDLETGEQEVIKIDADFIPHPLSADPYAITKPVTKLQVHAAFRDRKSDC